MTALERAAWKDAPKVATDRARQLEAARRIASGEIKVPIACSYCHSASVTEEDGRKGRLECLSCGRITNLTTARRIRQQKIRRIIADGVDIDVTKRRPESGR